MPFWHVPVMAEGTVPLAMRSVDLARPPDVPPAASVELPFTESDEPLGRRRSITLLDLQSGPSGTTLTWRVASREDQPFPAFSFGIAAGFRVVRRQPPGCVRPTSPADPCSGRPGRPRRRWLRARWLTSAEPASGYLECLCSDFGLWAAGLRTAGGASRGIHHVPAAAARHPQRRRRASRHSEPCRDVPVTPPAIDADRAVLGVGRVIVSDLDVLDRESAGRLADQRLADARCPTANQLRDYTARVDRIVDLPTP